MIDLDAELPGLIRQHLPSVWALEVLLQLKNDPERQWTVDEMVAVLRAAPGLVTRILAGLQRSGLALDHDGRHRFAPASSVLAEFADQVERLYRERPVSVINLISAPPDRLQQLADAFRIGGTR